MSSEKATAIVIRTVEFSETSLVVTLFTREFGKIGALAKGGRRLKGPFESALDLLALSGIVFLHKSSDALDLLTEAKLLRRFRPAGRDLGGLYAGYYIAELLDGLTDEDDPHPELFDLADQTLAALAAGDDSRGLTAPGKTTAPGETVAKLTMRFELGALRLLGHLPSLDHCVECGAAVKQLGRVAFGQLDGGVLCPDCRAGKKQIVMVNAGVLRTMAQLADTDGAAWRRTKIESAQPRRAARPAEPLCHATLGQEAQDARVFGHVGELTERRVPCPRLPWACGELGDAATCPRQAWAWHRTPHYLDKEVLMSIAGLRFWLLPCLLSVLVGCSTVPPAPPQHADQSSATGSEHEGWLWKSLTGQKDAGAKRVRGVAARRATRAAARPANPPEPAGPLIPGPSSSSKWQRGAPAQAAPR